MQIQILNERANESYFISINHFTNSTLYTIFSIASFLFWKNDIIKYAL